MSSRTVIRSVITAVLAASPAFAQRVTSGLVVYYPFTEGTGSVAFDQAGGTAQDVDLSGAVDWIAGQNGLDFAGGLAGTALPADKVISALQATNQSTFEAWIVADNTTQSGPARFISVGGDTTFQNFMFGQVGADVQARLVHTAKAADATPRLFTTDGFLTTGLTHIVHTFDGTTERLYVNGVQHPETVVLAGDYSNWDPTDLFTIGNETTGTRAFNGVIRLAAVYDRPLSGAEVTQNFSAGADVNATPVVDAGPNQTVTGSMATTLAGSFVDDDLPVPQASVTTLWTQISGPGTATFVDDTDPTTDVSFDLNGLYVLQLEADDTLLVGSAQVTIGVNVPVDGFTDFTGSALVAGPGHFGGHGVMWADVTGDARPDMYVTMNFQPTNMAELFYRNTNGTVFAEEGVARGISDFDSGSHGGVWGDLDNDGDYDLANGGYDRNRIWENDGTGAFTDRTTASGLIDVNNGTRGSLMFDYDNDGDLDLYFNNWGPAAEENEFYRNDGAFGFTRIDNGLQFALGAQGVTAGDVDNDGDLDLLFCRWNNNTGPIALYHNNGGVFTEATVPEFAVTANVQDGITLFDVDNDGWLDVHAKLGTGTAWLFLNNQDGATWTQVAVPTGPGYMAGFADLDNDGDADLVYPGDDVVYLNDGFGAFTASAPFTVGTINDPRAVAFADIDADGDIDFMVAQKRQFNMLLRNNLLAGATKRWLRVRLVSPFGQAGAFGARVRLYEPGMLGNPAGLIGMREASSQDGYLSQSDPVLHFGLGNRATVDVEVEFLEGTRFTQAGVAANQVLLADVEGQPIRPEVDAGTDQVTPEAPGQSPNMAFLSGTLIQDGLNGSPGSVTFGWSVVSEPAAGATAFGDDTAIATTATFSTSGVYILALTADNGSVTHTDTVMITANLVTDPPAVNVAPADLATGISVRPTLEIVCPATTPLGAQFMIASDAGFTAIVYDSGLVLNEVCSQIVLDSLASVQTYYWSARTQSHAEIWTAWSAPTSFTTTNPVLLSEIVLQDGVNGYSGTADTDVRGDYNNLIVPIREWNQGGQEVIRTGRRRPGSFTDEVYRALLRFDLTSLSDPDAVVNVYLELTGSEHGGEDIPFTTANRFYQVLVPWGEGDGLVDKGPASGEASWTYRLFPTAWNVPGVAGSGTDRSATPFLQGNLTNIIGHKTRWSNTALVNLVKAWIADPSSNHGLHFVAADESLQAVMNIASREAADGTTRPRLVIELVSGDPCAALPDNDPCDDGNACTTGDTCQSGVCTGGAPLGCDDGLYCNGPESCDSVSGCEAGVPPCVGQVCDENTDTCVDCLVDGDCDDGLFCTGGETCVANVCQSGSDPCPGQLCDESGSACVDCLVDGDCDDADACTGVETCVAGTCQAGTPLACDDGLFCTGAETCDATTGCLAGTNPCPGKVCDESTDTCSDCLVDGDCDDGQYCNGTETCVAGDCQAGTPVTCDDGVACTVDACDEMTNSCTATPDDGACADGVFCNGTETCDGVLGCLAGSPVTCDDGIACTTDSCNETSDTCDAAPNDGACADGLFCNGSEVCHVTLGCQAGTPVTCDDGVACTTDSCNETTDACDAVADDAACDDGVFCNGAETCDALLGCQAGNDPCPGSGCDEPTDACVVGRLESGTVTVGGTPLTVNLANTYANPVVVCSTQYTNNAIPIVTRVTNVTSGSFDVYLQNPSDAAVAAETVSYLVVEEGVWSIDGVAVEAFTFTSTVTDSRFDWQGTTLSYGTAFTAPVVLGQVMSVNDADWSAFWSRGVDRFGPPTATDLGAGKEVGEDPDVTRLDETIGVIVLETAHGTLGGVEFETALGARSVAGIDDGPPFAYPFNVAFATTPSVAVTTMAGMQGSNGGWSYLFGATPLSATGMNLAVDEDQVADTERGHTTEQIAYAVFASAVVYPPPAECVVDADCADTVYCNGAEACNAGTCEPGSDPCPGQICNEGTQSCDDCVVDADCDDADVCNGTETCVAGSCQAGTPLLCDDGQFCNGAETCSAALGCQAGGDPCPAQTCDEGTDQCVDCVVDGDCADGLFCNGVETCVAGACQAGTPVTCDDGVACTIDTCNETTDTCDATPDHGSCDDGAFCNGTETCNAVLGCQAGTPVTCDDGVACTIDTCNEATDACDATPDDTACDDGAFCNGAETCDGLLGCQAGTPVTCDDGVACTIDTCNESTDSCDATPDDTACDDGIFCNGAETCDAVLDCQAGSDPCPGQACNEGTQTCDDCVVDADCDDADVCTGAETCVVGSCQAGTPLVCDDGQFCNGAETCDAALGCRSAGDPCPGQSCDETADLCVDCLDDNDCTDGAFCNGVERCVGGVCQAGTPVTCDDGIGCTTDTCNEATDTCDATPDDATCDDGVFCNGAETCDVGVGCQAGTPMVCDDGVPCTIDTCNETTDTCDAAPDDTACDDGIFCNGAETCDAVLDCQAGSDPCPGQTCNEGTQTCDDCLVDADCDDGLYCNGAETCQAGSCTAGTPVGCDDGIDCTIDTCNETTDSCDAAPDDGACDDSVFCNGIETCDIALGCLGGTAVACDDGVACTTDTCNEATESCDATPDDGACGDGLFCNGAETCDAVLGCQAGTAPCGGQFCDESNDTCNGCQVDADCDDGTFCNGPETCVGGSCQAGSDPCAGGLCDEGLDACQNARLESGTVVATGTALTVPLTHTYIKPVIVCSTEYASNTVPIVTRVSNVTSTSFNVRLQNPSDAGVAPEVVHYVVVEEGNWTIDGVAVSAWTFDSTVTDWRFSWVGQNQTYGQPFVAPVVLGQVMSSNDPRWSVFWSRGADRFSPPTPTTIGAGKEVGEDPIRTRANETIGVVVIETGHGTIAGVEFEARLGPLSVMGIDDGPPFAYTFATPFAQAPEVAVTNVAGMQGSNGGWSYAYGAAPLLTTGMDLVIDEDQTADAERSHASEQVAYLVFADPVVFPPVFVCGSDPECDDGLFCNGAETCAAGSCVAGGEPCPGQSCDEGLGCVDCLSDGDCADSTVCNGDETCVAGTCQAGSPLSCDDSVFCNGLETCDATLGCQAGSDPCPGQSCNEGSEQCEDCQVDADCDDGVFCNGPETCSGGTCQAGAAITCDDGVGCTVDTCNEIGLTCDHVTNHSACDDGVFCNGAETCDAALDCVAGTPVNCDDAIACTLDSCNETTDSCDHAADNAACDDGLFCNGPETCGVGVGCQSGAAPCAGEPCDDSTDTCVECLVDADCDDGVFCNGAETCSAGLCAAGSDPCGGLACAEATDTCAAARLESGTVTVGGTAQTVTLAQTYVTPVVVCSSDYANNTLPIVPRVRNVTATSFEVYLQNPSDQAVVAETVNYLVVEAGTWVIDGVEIGARRVNTTQTDYRFSWVGHTLTYSQSYSAPVVLGQVMTTNDPDWSAFWSRGIDRFGPPTPSALGVGLEVGEDPDRTRLSETLGVIVIQAGSGVLGGVAYEAGLGPISVEGMDDAPPYTYTFNVPFATTPQVAVTTIAGMLGSNGGWAYTHGATPLTPTTMRLAIDEDQTGDAERSHAAEQVGYIVFESPVVIP